EPHRGPQGRPLARASGLAALGRAGGGRPRASRARGRGHRRRLRRDRAPARGRSRRGVHRAPRPGRRGRHRPGAARGARHPLHRLGRARLPALVGQDPDQAPPARGRTAHPGVLRAGRDRLRGARRPRRPAGHRGATVLSDRGQAGDRRFGAGDQVRPRGRRRARGPGRRVLLRRPRCARAPRAWPRPRGLDPRRRRRAGGAADRRGRPARRGLLRLRGPLRDRSHELRVPGRARACADPADAQTRARHLRVARALRIRPGRPHARGGERRAVRARSQRNTGADRDEPAASGGGGPGHRARRADRAHRGAGARARSRGRGGL
ncbi:MAG: D-alanine--D-alanine ligase, partial [uncultured Solirubrobacterales bacterium]